LPEEAERGADELRERLAAAAAAALRTPVMAVARRTVALVAARAAGATSARANRDDMAAGRTERGTGGVESAATTGDAEQKEKSGPLSERRADTPFNKNRNFHGAAIRAQQ